MILCQQLRNNDHRLRSGAFVIELRGNLRVPGAPLRVSPGVAGEPIQGISGSRCRGPFDGILLLDSLAPDPDRDQFPVAHGRLLPDQDSKSHDGAES